MNPKAAETWNFALARMAAAKTCIDNEQNEPAKTEIAKAVYVGAGALLYALGPGPAEQTAHQVAQGFITEMADEDCSAADAYNAAYKILTCIADMTDPNDPLPTP